MNNASQVFTVAAPLPVLPLSAFRGLKGIEIADGHRLFTLKNVVDATVTRGADEDGAYLRFELETVWSAGGPVDAFAPTEPAVLFLMEDGEAYLTDVRGVADDIALSADQLRPLLTRLGL